MLLELERRLQTLATGGKEARLGVSTCQRLSITFAKFRLIVKRIDLGWTPRLEEPDNRFRFGGEMAVPSGEGIIGTSSACLAKRTLPLSLAVGHSARGHDAIFGSMQTMWFD